LYGYVEGDPLRLIDPQGLDWSTSAQMTFEWATGKGPAARAFGPGSSPVEGLKNNPKVAIAIALYKTKNNFGSGCDCSKARSLTNYKASFGIPGLLDAGLNPTRQFVGSYRIDIYPLPNCRMRVVVTNTSSFKSFAAGQGPEWERSTFGPMGNTRQAYWWIE